VLDAMTAELLAKRPEDRYSSATELAEDLRRVRDGLPLLAAAGLGEQRRTAQTSQDTGKTRAEPTVVAHGGRGSGPAASRTRQWALAVPLVALLVGMALLSVLTWALGGSTSNEGTPEAGGVQRVEAPAVVGLSRDEAQRRLDNVGLKLGLQEEASSDEVAEGAVIRQVPAAETEVARGSAVNVTLSTGPAQKPATQSSPTASPSAQAANAEQPEKAAKEAKKAAEEAAEKRHEERAKTLEEAQKAAEE
jgi:eukaryotic-like serine/threonine-protein kinase